MRFGWLAAAAAVLGAGQASAATFVWYQAQGTGTIVTCCGYPPPTKVGDLFFNFVVEVDPGYSNGLSFGNGSYFHNEHALTFSLQVSHPVI